VKSGFSNARSFFVFDPQQTRLAHPFSSHIHPPSDNPFAHSIKTNFSCQWKTLGCTLVILSVSITYGSAGHGTVYEAIGVPWYFLAYLHHLIDHSHLCSTLHHLPTKSSFSSASQSAWQSKPISLLPQSCDARSALAQLPVRDVYAIYTRDLLSLYGGLYDRKHSRLEEPHRTHYYPGL
jgi:hypothetical protein